MPLPYDYSIRPNIAISQAGGELGQIISGIRQRNKAEEKAVVATEQAEALKKQYSLDVQEAFKNPTPQSMARLIAKHPKQREAFKQGWDLLNEDQKSNELQTTGQVYSALLSNNTEVANNILDEQITARSNSGQDTSKLQNIKDYIERDPKGAAGYAGLVLSSIMGEKEFAKTFKTLGEERRAGIPSEKWKVLNNKEKKELGLPQNNAFQIDEDGKISQIGGKGVSVTVEGAKQFGTIPPGMQLEEVNGAFKMSPIPGSPAEQKAKALVEKKKLSKGVTKRAAGVVFEDIGRLKKKIEEAPWYSPVLGLGGQALSFIPGTNRVDAEALKETVVANIGFDRLQQMREASPTGGALGAISERELSTLQAVLGSLSLSQSEKQLTKNIDRLNVVYKNILKKAEAYPGAEEFGFGAIEIVETRITPDGKTIVKYSDGSFELK